MLATRFWTHLLVLTVASTVFAQQNPPNPFVAGEPWGSMPEGRTWGSSSAIFPDRNIDQGWTGRIWVAERCAGSHCRNNTLDPILLFEADGTLVRSFGSRMFIWPHGIHVDREGSVWVTDAVHTNCDSEVTAHIGHQVHKFSQDGRLLMSLGTAGHRGGGTDAFSCPSDVVVADSGDIFVADGHNHGHGGSNRMVRFDAEGRFVETWGEPGSEDGQFLGIHALAIDRRGRLFVGDRANSRIQIMSFSGEHIATWRQFGSPSGMFIDDEDTLYVADSDSGFDPEGDGDPRNPGYPRGIYIGDAHTGEVRAFIPDPRPDLSRVTSGAEGVALSGEAVFGAQVGGSRGVLRYARK